MSKGSGLGMGLDIDGVDLSGDTNAIGSLGGGLSGTMDMQGIDKFGFERQGLLRDGKLEWASYFNPASAPSAHVSLSGLTIVDRVALIRFPPQAIGSGGAGMVGKQLDYAGKRDKSGALLFDVSVVCNGFGMEFGTMLTAGKRSDSAATNGTSFDYGAAIGTTAFGLQMYYQLYSFTGTSVAIKIQSSTDDAVGDPYADVTGATSGALSAVGAGRVATAPNASIERWLRVVTTGTFSQATFAVLAVRNQAAPAF